MQSLYPDAIGVDEITRLTLTMADAAAEFDLDAAVPTCDGWTVGDLVWHLTEVQDFWTYIIAARPAGPKNYERPTRANPARLVANLRNAVAGLADVLRTSSTDEEAWSWASDHTVGFTLRRQTHEALTHCIDAILAAGQPLPHVSPELAADGIDEMVHVMLDAPDPDATGTILLVTTDTGDTWSIRNGSEDATIAGSALDLNLWLWGRAKSWPLTVTGATEQAGALRDLIATNTQ